ncbi:MAG: hypothetical protein RBT42_03785 [Aquabacterium sp.]|jgi:hypothetical protein|uniref:hypothetical protein n=1 Tax=Aquabacterium sp. TaxID=1872578 RepID=UPI002A35C99A|nr:hypothetical protein [Aquabacterium sp.]MDX9842852.1 hypothetical protein [Aquabacterium sp.]
MTFATVRSVSIAAAVALSAFSAQALTISTNALKADSFQVFSESALQSYALFNVGITALGNATAVAGTTDTFSLPVTSISIALSGGIKIENGKATGSALEISRMDPATGKKRGLTIANFTIDFAKSQVLADTTVIGGTTQPQAPVYNFVKTQELALKYKFPLSISLKEQLGDLRLVDVNGTADALGIDRFLANAVIPQIDFGVINIDIGVAFRSKPVSTKPYVPAL